MRCRMSGRFGSAHAAARSIGRSDPLGSMARGYACLFGYQCMVAVIVGDMWHKIQQSKQTSPYKPTTDGIPVVVQTTAWKDKEVGIVALAAQRHAYFPAGCSLEKHEPLGWRIIRTRIIIIITIIIVIITTT